jgi:hypothetical protein
MRSSRDYFGMFPFVQRAFVIVSVVLGLTACETMRHTFPDNTKNRPIQLAWSPDLKLDHDQGIVCAFNAHNRAMYCSSPEEFEVRFLSGR